MRFVLFSNKLFTKLRTLGNFLKQWDLIQLLLKYTTSNKALTTDDLLFIAKGPAFTRVRNSLQKMTNKNFDKVLNISHGFNQNLEVYLIFFYFLFSIALIYCIKSTRTRLGTSLLSR